MDKILMAILALLVGIVLGVIIILVVGYFRGKRMENKATKIIDQAKKDSGRRLKSKKEMHFLK